MNIDLFNVDLVSLFGFATGLSAAFLMGRLVTRKNYYWYGLMIGVSLIVSLGITLVIRLLFSPDALVPLLWLKVIPVPFAVGSGILVLRSHAKRRRWWLHVSIASATIVMGICFSLAMINVSYHYYPTLYSLLGLQSVGAAPANQATTISFNPHQVRTGTIEGSLYAAEGTLYKGRIESLTIPGAVSGFKPRPGWVYIPAIADSPAKVNLPVLILTAGVPGNPNDWLNGGGIVATLDGFAKIHHGITPYVFVVDNLGSTFNDTECVDSPRGHVETYLTQDIPTYIKTHYEVTLDPSGWGLGGLSMGGMCAVMLTLRHPDVYHVFLDFGGEQAPEVGSPAKTIASLFYGSNEAWQEHQPHTLLAQHEYPGIMGYFAAGKGDDPVVLNETHGLYLAAQQDQLEVVYEALGGEHTFSVWSHAFKDSLPWVSNKLNATDCSGRCY